MREQQRILAQCEAVRRSGHTNMLDKNTVQRIAYECDFHALVCFIEDADNGEYMKMIQRASSEFDNPKAGLPVDDVPEQITFETTITLG